MKRFLLICLALFSAVGFAGCLFSKKSAKPKENQEISASTEATFKQRWMERRITELKATGLKPEAAEAQASEEFRTRYGYTGAAQK